MVTGIICFVIALLLLVVSAIMHLDSGSKPSNDKAGLIFALLFFAIGFLIAGGMILDGTAEVSNPNCVPTAEIIDTDKGTD